MAILYVCVALSMLSAVATLIAEYLKKDLIKFLTKCSASAFFFLAAVFGVVFVRYDVFSFMLFALFFNFIGDLFLCQFNVVKQEYVMTMDIVGGTCFVIGNLSLAALFIYVAGEFNYFLIILAVSLPIIVAVCAKCKLLRFDNTPIIMCLYALAVGILLSACVNLYLVIPSVKTAVIVAAGTLFAFSDGALFANNYSKLKSIITKSFCIIPYYAAQCIFALAIIL